MALLECVDKPAPGIHIRKARMMPVPLPRQRPPYPAKLRRLPSLPGQVTLQQPAAAGRARLQMSGTSRVGSSGSCDRTGSQRRLLAAAVTRTHGIVTHGHVGRTTSAQARRAEVGDCTARPCCVQLPVLRHLATGTHCLSAWRHGVVPSVAEAGTLPDPASSQGAQQHACMLGAR
jgi:hypothetical protein